MAYPPLGSVGTFPQPAVLNLSGRDKCVEMARFGLTGRKSLCYRNKLHLYGRRLL